MKKEEVGGCYKCGHHQVCHIRRKGVEAITHAPGQPKDKMMNTMHKLLAKGCSYKFPIEVLWRWEKEEE